MFELLDDHADSPERMPSPRFNGNRASNPAATLNGYLLLVAMGGLVLGESLHAWRAVQIAAWSIAAAAGWWFVYRYVFQLQATWQSTPARRTRILIGSVASVLFLLMFVYAAAIKSEALLLVGCAVGWSLSLLTDGVKYLRHGIEPPDRTLFLIETALWVLTLVVLVYAMAVKSDAVTRDVWVLIFNAPLLQLFRERPQESP